MNKTGLSLIIVLCLLFSRPVSGQVSNILINHLGYESDGPKHAVIKGTAADSYKKFNIVNYNTGKVVFTGTPEKKGPVQKWKDWFFWTVDFDNVTEKGIYYIECNPDKGKTRSFPFTVQDNVLERNTISDVIYYFKSQRCSGLLDKADRNMKFSGSDRKPVDVHGGWYDASGDYGKNLSHLSFSTYFNPQQTPLTVWSLFKTLEALERRGDSNFTQYKKRLIDEAMYGADFLVRMKNPAGSFYRTISASGPEKKAEDRRISPAMKGFSIYKKKPEGDYDPEKREKVTKKNTYETGYRSGAGISIAALAIAGTYKISGEYKNSDYLKSAEEAFKFLEENNIYFANDGKENIVDDYCALPAAVELYKATKKSVYKNAADKRAKNLMNRLVSSGKYKNYWRSDERDRPFFHAADGGFPLVSLLYYLEIADKETNKRVLDTVKKSLNFELEITDEITNPFGLSRQYVQNIKGERRSSFFFPHETETRSWWQGENARLGSMAAAAGIASGYFKENKEFCNKLRVFARNQLNWILGLNPFDVCMLHGTGRNNPWYMFFESYEYTNCPGGICNGITAGLYDRENIDFQLSYKVTGKDNDWRWGEQWLPHSSWFLLAVAVRK